MRESVKVVGTSFGGTLACLGALALLGSGGPQRSNPATTASPTIDLDPVVAAAAETITRGRQLLRFDTFGDEVFWTDAPHVDGATSGTVSGGVGLQCGRCFPAVDDTVALDLRVKREEGRLDDFQPGGARTVATHDEVVAHDDALEPGPSASRHGDFVEYLRAL